MLSKIVSKLVGTKQERDIKKLYPLVQQVNDLEPSFQKLDDQQLLAKTAEFRERLGSGESLDTLLPEAFAAVREASVRSLGMRHFDVQIMGGAVLHQGKIAEMRTGEGKTLTSTLSIYLNALPAKGVHVVTVNDYLASRDAQWMAPIYKALGLSVGFIKSGMAHAEKQLAYGCDITYGTNNEFGFDYLRDNMVEHRSFKVQRDHAYAIVDEVDSILVDEARTPLIISGPAESSTENYVKVNKLIPKLEKDADFEIDEKARNILLTEIGVAKLEKLLEVDNLYEPANLELVHHINQALKAHYLFEKDVDYMVQHNEVVIVDEFTGRLLEGRRYSDGLHQAIEAKERVPIKQENQTLASITFQNYFRMYSKLAGMTGTADTEAEEFKKIYSLDVVVLPTNKPMARIDEADQVFRTESEKINAIIEDVKSKHKNKQPVLVGTTSIEASEKISSSLKKAGIPHSVLNAKFHAQEADIIKNAGQPGTVTIATNMAGRGTDIVLGTGVREAGGLHIIGSERHESRRIDNQLRGRSGRQGDSGSSRFYLSLEDNLMRIFGSDRIGPMLQKLGMQEGDVIEHKWINSAIARAQKQVEARNFDVRKHLLEYDDVMNKQRTFIYGIRNRILSNDSIQDIIESFLDDSVVNQIELFLPGKSYDEWDEEGFKKWLAQMLMKGSVEKLSALDSQNKQELEKETFELLYQQYKNRREEYGDSTFNLLEKMVSLQVIDQRWKDHLYTIDQVRDGVWALGYSERNPIVEYRKQAFAIFDEMVEVIKTEIVEYVFRAQIQGQLSEQVPEAYETVGQEVFSSPQNALADPQQEQAPAAAISGFGQVRNSQGPTQSKAAESSAGGSSQRRSSRKKKR